MEEIEYLYMKITFKRKLDYFGSFAHGIGAKDSDIDLLIVGYLIVSSFIFIFSRLSLGSFLVLLKNIIGGSEMIEIARVGGWKRQVIIQKKYRRNIGSCRDICR